jgi:hypothetical protein
MHVHPGHVLRRFKREPLRTQRTRRIDKRENVLELKAFIGE